MSEQNVLNPTTTSLFGPDYGFGETLPEMRAIFQARSGTIFSRQQQGLGRVFGFNWNGRDLATKLAFQQWENQYRDDFFSIADWESGRYFTGRFAAPLTYSPAGNNQWNIQGQFMELPGLAMFAYPSNYARDAMFLEERNGFGEDLVKLTGTGWAFQTNAHAHGGSNYVSATTNDTAEWSYFGYSFRFWSLTENDVGIAEVSCTRVRDGSVFIAPTNVDLYHSSAVASAPLFDAATVKGFPLDFYRVKLRVTGTKNASSSGFSVCADAIEVMR